MSETITASKLKPIRQEDLGRYTETVEIDVNANAFQKPSPIPDGLYEAALAVSTGQYARELIQGGTDKNGNDYFFGNFDVKVIKSLTDTVEDSQLQGKRKTLDGRVTTFEKTDQLGRSTNEMAAVAIVAGAVPQGSTLGEIGFAFMEAVRSGAHVGVLTEWQASVKDAKGHYNIVKRGMTSFPKNVDDEGTWDGTYNPTITYDGVEVTARAGVKAFVRLT